MGNPDRSLCHDICPLVGGLIKDLGSSGSVLHRRVKVNGQSVEVNLRKESTQGYDVFDRKIVMTPEKPLADVPVDAVATCNLSEIVQERAQKPGWETFIVYDCQFRQKTMNGFAASEEK